MGRRCSGRFHVTYSTEQPILHFVLKTTEISGPEKFFAILTYLDPENEGENALGVRTPDFESFGELRMFVSGAMSPPSPYASALLRKFTDLELTVR